MLRNECGHDNFILANPHINDQFKNIPCLFSQNVNLILKTLLHGAIHMFRLNYWNNEVFVNQLCEPTSGGLI